MHDDGRVVLAGHVAQAARGYDMTLLRLLADGRIDPLFGDAGRTFVDLGGDDRAWSLLLLGDGKYLAGGQASSDKEGKKTSFAIARFDVNGRPDPAFGDQGATVTTFPSGPALARGAAATGTGFWLGGFAIGDGGHDFAMARYNASGLLDPCPSDSGIVTIPVASGQDDEAFAMTVAARQDAGAGGPRRRSPGRRSVPDLALRRDGQGALTPSRGGRAAVPVSGPLSR